MPVGWQAACRPDHSRVSVRQWEGKAVHILHERERMTLLSGRRKPLQASAVAFFSGAGRFPVARYGPGH